MSITIPLPEDVNVKVKAGQTVDFKTPFYTVKTAVQQRLAISEYLNVPPKKIFQYLKKFVGDTVKKGDIIARHKSFLSTKLYHSQQEGVIREIRHQDGSVILDVTTDNSLTINCYFLGEITSIEKKHIVLKINHVKEVPLKQTSTFFGGKKLIQTASNQLTAEQIEDHVVCCETIPQYELVKYDALGCRGIVSMHAIDTSDTSLPIAYLKKHDDWKELHHDIFSYCLITHNPDTLFLYS